MSKAIKMGKTSATGSYHLFLGKIASSLMLGIGTILVGMFIAEGDLGLYTIALIPAGTFLLFQDWGISAALTKYCAAYKDTERGGELRNIIVKGLSFGAITALALTLLSLLTANFVTSTIFGNSESVFLVTLSSITILSAAIYGTCISIFVGFERMKLSTIAMIISAIVQGILSPLLVYLGFGALGALVGFTVSSGVSAITALTLLYFIIFKKLPIGNFPKPKFFKTLKPLLHYGFPISIASIIGGLSPQITAFAMASFTDLAIIGNYRIAINFAVFLTFFIYPIQTVLFPAFSKLNPSKDKQLLKTVFASSIKYSSLFLVPATLGLIVLGAPLINAIYGEKWLSAPLFLALNIMGNLLVLVGSMSYSRLLYATGETKLIMKLETLKTCIAVPFAFLLIPPFGIFGVIASGIMGGLPPAIIGIYLTWRRYETKADFQNSIRIFLASTIAGVTTYLFLITSAVASWILLIVGAVLFLAIYIISIALVGAVNQMDIDNLRNMFSGLGPISKLLGILLILIEKPLKVKEKFSKMRKLK